MLEKLNDIVWSINPENDSVGKMETRIRNYASMTLNPLGINFSLTIRTPDHEVLKDMHKKRNLFLIIKEALYNAAKYADCRNIHLLIEERQGHLYIKIEDDGKGFDLKTLSAYNGHGLRSMRERAKAMSAKMEIVSSEGIGTKIILES
jgi:signal transduction histidine kinase